MTDTNTAQLSGETKVARRPINQRPSFSRRHAPIDRLPFLGHWLLSLALLVIGPLVVLKLADILGLGAIQFPLMLLAALPGAQLYWVSARRRLLGMGAKTYWRLLIVPFWVVSAFNGFDGAMSGMGLAQGPTIPPLVGSLLLLPAVVLHFVLMLRRGAPKSKATT